jgi:hypothetical protein
MVEEKNWQMGLMDQRTPKLTATTCGNSHINSSSTCHNQQICKLQPSFFLTVAQNLLKNVLSCLLKNKLTQHGWQRQLCGLQMVLQQLILWTLVSSGKLIAV